jgi:hypothetical protein
MPLDSICLMYLFNDPILSFMLFITDHTSIIFKLHISFFAISHKDLNIFYSVHYLSLYYNLQKMHNFEMVDVTAFF